MPPRGVPMCRSSGIPTSCAVHLVLLDHRLRFVGAEANVLPHPEKIDLRRVLEPLSGLHHGAERADLLSVDDPRVELTALGRFQPLQTRSAVLEPRLDSVRV